MDANQACNVLLSNLKESNLNWNLLESPFSLTINLKKSFIKDREGNPRTSGFTKQYYKQNDHNNNLKHVMEENNSLKKALANMEHKKDEVIEILDAKEE